MNGSPMIDCGRRRSVATVVALAALATLVGWLAGCSSVAVKPAATANPDAQRQADFDKSMERWHGASATELVGKLGAPSAKSKLADGTQVYAYAKSKQLQGPIGPVAFSCVVRFSIDERSGLIVGHRIEGC